MNPHGSSSEFNNLPLQGGGCSLGWENVLMRPPCVPVKQNWDSGIKADEKLIAGRELGCSFVGMVSSFQTLFSHMAHSGVS